MKADDPKRSTKLIRSTFVAVVLIVVVTAMSPRVADAQLSMVDPGIKELVFAGDFVFLSEAPVETIEGTVPGAKGRVTTNTEDLSQTSGTISVSVMGMKAGNKTRDKHVVGERVGTSIKLTANLTGSVQ